jgi:YggT family protein
MFILANFVEATAEVLYYVLHFYMFIVIARALISWVNPDPYNPIVRFLYSATEPVLYRIRRALPFSTGGIDFSPFVLVLGIVFLQTFLVRSLHQVAQSLN